MNIYLARQPIYDLQSNVFAYELLYRSNGTVNSYTGVDGDESTADVIINAFFDMHMQSIIGNKKAFINFTGNLLKRGVPKMLPPESMVVEILENILIDDEILDAVAELKDLGYTIALDDFMYQENSREIFELGDIVKIDFRFPKHDIDETSYICRYSNKIMLAEKVETLEEIDYAKRIGCVYFQGYYYSKPLLMSKKSTSPMSATYMKVLHLISTNEPDIEAIVDVISKDAALTQRLLRLINSVYFGFNSKISNVSQALMLLGIDHLREWIYLMGLRRIYGKENTEILSLALFRARFCEGLGKMIPSAKRIITELYLMGLLSIVPIESETGYLSSLDEFPVSDEIKNGIRGNGGLHSDICQLTLNYENGNWIEVDRISENYRLDRKKLSALYMDSLEQAKRLKFYN